MCFGREKRRELKGPLSLTVHPSLTVNTTSCRERPSTFVQYGQPVRLIMTDLLLHSFHSEFVDLLYFHIFDKVQRTRRRGKALALYEELGSRRPPRLSTFARRFRANHKRMLSACTCRLLESVRAGTGGAGVTRRMVVQKWKF